MSRRGSKRRMLWLVPSSQQHASDWAHLEPASHGEPVAKLPGIRRELIANSGTPSPKVPLTCGGGPKGIRTPDLLAASQTLYQLSYGPAGGSV